MTDPTPLRFAHEAMNATFEILLPAGDPHRAPGAAQAAFDELDRIELELSRFHEASDVFQIGLLPAGGALVLGEAAFECLALSTRIHADTGGAFDPTLGAILRCRRDAEGRERRPTDDELAEAAGRSGLDKLRLHERTRTVTVAAPGIEVDLGGVGKGYGVDRMAGLLGDWGLGPALIRAGESTVLAVGAPPGRDAWPLPIRDPAAPDRPLTTLELTGAALGVSGTLHRGGHVIDPRTGRAADRGIPTTNFGAGDFNVCHQPDEWVSADDLVRCAQTVLGTAVDLLNQGR